MRAPEISQEMEIFQGWRLNHFPGQPLPMLYNPFSEVKFPNIQSKPPLVQLEAISSRPITCYLGEETDPHLSTTSFQVVVESNKVSPQPPFLQAKQPQFPQLLLIRLTLHQLRCPSLDTLQHLNVFLVVRGPKLNTVFEGHDHFPSPAGHAISDTSQDAIGFLGHLGTLLAHIQQSINQHPQVLSCQAAFQPLFPKPVALHGVVVTQERDPTLSLVEPHRVGPSPSIQPVQIPLAFLPSSRSTLPHDLVSSANLLRVNSIPSSRSLIKMLNRTGPNAEPWGTPLVTGCQLEFSHVESLYGNAQPHIDTPVQPSRSLQQLCVCVGQEKQEGPVVLLSYKSIQARSQPKWRGKAKSGCRRPYRSAMKALGGSQSPARADFNSPGFIRTLCITIWSDCSSYN
ncbi:LOW QUALITY PROTEIN: hypothetical protein QYF61_021155 [Mycteria americana]|uniref:Uncharacterized protein n=1 Tax=Mycteria americana TaxID=33587 RepID=A0AAN7NLR1_MYCAM|nr:LOW QUALITY PROTEIN: hypothetical protein QYF61_021155 [Mycteria americana]